MNKFNILMMSMLFGMHGYVHSTITPTASGQFTIQNNSNFSIKVNSVAADKAVQITTVIPAGQSGTLPYTGGVTIALLSISYLGTDGVTVTTPQLSFEPMNMGAALYVYGNSAVAPLVTDSTNSSLPLPSRYAGWVIGSINQNKSTAAQLESEPVATQQSYITMYQLNADGSTASNGSNASSF